MEDLESQFIQCFDALHLNDNDAIHEADQLINQLSLHDDAIPVLTNILQNTNPYYRFHAAITLRLSLRGHDNESFSPGNLISTLLGILSDESDLTIRGYLTFVIGAQLINEETLPLEINFAQMALGSADQQQIHSAILLFDNSLEYFKNADDEFIQFVNQLSSTAVNFDDIQLILDTLSFFFKFTHLYHDIPDELASDLWSKTINLFPSLVDDVKNINELSQIVAESIDDNLVCVNVEPLLPICIQLISSDDLDYNVRNSLTYVIDAIISIHSEFFVQSGMAVDIFRLYVQFAFDEYNPNEPLDKYDSSIMMNICQTLSTYEEFLSMVWSAIKEFPEDDQGNYVSMIVLKYLFNAEVDFFYKFFDDIAGQICASIQSESISTSEAGIECLLEFVVVFTDIDDYIESFEKVLLELLKERPTISTIDAFTELIKKSKDTDNIFEEAFGVLFQLLSQGSVESNNAILYSLSNLSLRSYSGVQNNFETILGLMIELLENETEEAELLRGDVVECFTNLMRVSPDNFQACLESFIPAVLNFLSSEDSNLICATLNCIGTLVDLFPEYIEGEAPTILDITEKFSLDDKSEYFEKIRDLFEKGFTGDDIDDMTETPVIDNDSFEISGGAFLVFSSILSKFPALYQGNFARAVNIIKVLSKSVIENSTRCVCAGVRYLMEQYNGEETEDTEDTEDTSLIEEIYINLKIIIEKASSPEILGSAISAIAAVIDAAGIQSLGSHVTVLPDDIISILQLNLNCFYVDQEELPECLYSPLIIFFGTIFNNLAKEDCQDFMKDIIPIIIELSEKSNGEKAFSLDVMMNYAQCGFDADPDFFQKALELSIECINNCRSSGFVALETLSALAPDLLKEHAENLLKLYAAKLADDNKAQLNYQLMMDDCVSSLGAFAMNILDNDFPLDQFGQIVLSKMPPKEDYQATMGCYNFLLWMIPKGISFLKADFIAAFARLFSLQPFIFERMAIQPEYLNTYKQTFVKLLQMTPEAEEICSQAVDNDPAKVQLIQKVIES